MNITFNKIFDEVIIKTEGGFVNDPDDLGGITYMGISYNANPNWEGWSIVFDKMDSLKTGEILNNDFLMMLVKDFYYTEYYTRINLDKIDIYYLCLELFDIAVNMGVLTAGKFLQQSLNILNRNEKVFDDLRVDGIIGQKTIEAINKLIDTKPLIRVLNYFQMDRYIKLCEKHPEQEKFMYGWIKRV